MPSYPWLDEESCMAYIIPVQSILLRVYTFIEYSLGWTRRGRDEIGINEPIILQFFFIGSFIIRINNARMDAQTTRIANVTV